MEIIVGLLMAALLLAAVLYVEYRLPVHVRNTAVTWLVRGILALVGIGMGMLFAAQWGLAGYPHRWIGFLIGFGAAHLPAAAILFIKRQRHEYG